MKQTERLLAVKTVGFLHSEIGRAKLEQMADNMFEHLRGSLSSSEVRGELARGFATPLHAKLASGALSWQAALPESVRTLIAERLQAQVNPLLEGAAKWMEEPSVVAAIAKMLQEKVENIPLIGPMAKSFLTPDRVAAEIVPRLQSVIVSGTTRQLVVEKMEGTLNGFWSRPVGQYLGRLSVDDLGGLLDKLIDNLFERVLSEDVASREMFRDLIVNGLVAGANEKTVGDLLRRILEALAGWNLRELYIKHTDDVDRLITKWWRYLRGQLIDGIPALLEALSIRQVVREQVASYPIPTLEKLILSVVNRELRLITILGGVLGGMIGLVQALLLI